MHAVGSVILEMVVNSDGGGYQGKKISRDNGNEYEFKGCLNKVVLTVLGEVEVKRAYYYDQLNKQGCFPKDELLDIKGTTFSPGVRRMSGRSADTGPLSLGIRISKNWRGSM